MKGNILIRQDFSNDLWLILFTTSVCTYHPQKDVQTEVVNKILGNLLRSLVTEQGHQLNQILAQA